MSQESHKLRRLDFQTSEEITVESKERQFSPQVILGRPVSRWVASPVYRAGPGLSLYQKLFANFYSELPNRRYMGGRYVGIGIGLATRELSTETTLFRKAFFYEFQTGSRTRRIEVIYRGDVLAAEIAQETVYLLTDIGETHCQQLWDTAFEGGEIFAAVDCMNGSLWLVENECSHFGGYRWALNSSGVQQLVSTGRQ